ncbi:MAG: response regulator [Verrucomicrobiota bacterium]|nr:response regulator [Verrucomicrobiota bacterium]
MHGGRIYARSEGEGKGSEFIVRLPLAPATPEPADRGAQSRTEPAAKTARLLVVNDHVDTALSLARLLRARRNVVEVVHDGGEALQAAERFQPDVVLLDLGLPGLDGYEVAKQLRAKETGRRATIIAISGYGQEEDRQRSREVGIDHHLVKPVTFPQLETLLAGQ